MFTLKEANKIIPKIEEIFDGIFVLRKKIAFAQNEMNWIKEFWRNDMRDSDNPDGDLYDSFVTEIEFMHKQIMKSANQIQSFGCIVKDVNTGLVDFYSSIKKQNVFLCWQYGEKEIKYWHTIDSGFTGRLPLGSTERIRK